MKKLIVLLITLAVCLTQSNQILTDNIIKNVISQANPNLSTETLPDSSIMYEHLTGDYSIRKGGYNIALNISQYKTRENPKIIAFNSLDIGYYIEGKEIPIYHDTNMDGFDENDYIIAYNQNKHEYDGFNELTFTGYAGKESAIIFHVIEQDLRHELFFKNPHKMATLPDYFNIVLKVYPDKPIADNFYENDWGQTSIIEMTENTESDPARESVNNLLSEINVLLIRD
ncbi:hypothetical protein HOE31_01995 [bacterium]|mgnify:CR=1 FL=1|nr:hypothetical protein [bacterium]MBT4121703.1 hypothetical protein [bacterium]MBT4335075.1 hypothetical protein [bacterium]MBT4495933.1 hypothetical protein [bacterium]MBT4764281.1 hypothetical protein [bacterium]